MVFLKQNETLNEASYRVLAKLTGLEKIYLEQLEAYSEVDRDPAERTISVAFYALIKIDENDENLLKQHNAQWFSLTELPELIFDHQAMINRAIRRLRYKTSIQPIGLELLPEKFTLKQLQTLYETILGVNLDKRNFIKKANTMNVLIKLNEKDMSSSKKGSFLFTFNKEKYQKRISEDIVFKL